VTIEFQRHLAALDLDSRRLTKSIVVPLPNAQWPVLHRNRASLLLADGVVYLVFPAFARPVTYFTDLSQRSTRRRFNKSAKFPRNR
jgi:hypothetical protein